MFTAYKPGVLRPELIRLKTAFAKGVSCAKVVLENKPKKSKWFGSGKEPDMNELSFSMLSEVMEARLNAMIELCDHAFETEHVLYLDQEDLMYMEQLRGLEKFLKEGGIK